LYFFPAEPGLGANFRLERMLTPRIPAKKPGLPLKPACQKHLGNYATLANLMPVQTEGIFPAFARLTPHKQKRPSPSFSFEKLGEGNLWQ
jgi:hypothetical protein